MKYTAGGFVWCDRPFYLVKQPPGAGRTRAGHHHGSHTPTSPEAVLLGKMAYRTKQIRRECTLRSELSLQTGCEILANKGHSQNLINGM